MNDNSKNLRIARTFVQKKGDKKYFNTPTLKHIAKKAGVSFQTVSHALNSTGRVSEKTRDMIRKIVSEMHYTPNAIARSFTLQRTNTVGLLFPFIFEPNFFAKIYRGIEDTLERHGYFAILCCSDNDVKKERRYLEILEQRRVDGLIMHPDAMDESNRDYVLRLKRKIPVVFIDRLMREVETDYVVSDNRGGGYKLTKHLLGLGHKRIAIILGDDYMVTSVQDRLEGYRRALAEADIIWDERMILKSDNMVGAKSLETVQARGADITRRILDISERPTAIFVITDVLIKPVFEVIQEKGLRVPEDIAVVGFDDSGAASSAPIPVTTVAQQIYEMGQTAANIFLEKVKNPDTDEIKRIELETKLVIRESCGVQLVRMTRNAGYNRANLYRERR